MKDLTLEEIREYKAEVDEIRARLEILDDRNGIERQEIERHSQRLEWLMFLLEKSGVKVKEEKKDMVKTVMVSAEAKRKGFTLIKNEEL